MRKESIITKELKDQILAVRNTGKTNMFLVPQVQKIASDMDLLELVVFLENQNNRKAYCEFILHGDKKPQ